jgi:hypothetical protein
MSNMYTNNDNKSMFSIGYPKRIFFKHIVPSKIYRDNFNNILGVRSSRVEFWKIVSSPLEESELINKNPVSDVIVEQISKPLLTRTKSIGSFF